MQFQLPPHQPQQLQSDLPPPPPSVSASVSPCLPSAASATVRLVASSYRRGPRPQDVQAMLRGATRPGMDKKGWERDGAGAHSSFCNSAPELSATEAAAVVPAPLPSAAASPSRSILHSSTAARPRPALNTPTGAPAKRARLYETGMSNEAEADAAAQTEAETAAAAETRSERKTPASTSPYRSLQARGSTGESPSASPDYNRAAVLSPSPRVSGTPLSPSSLSQSRVHSRMFLPLRESDVSVPLCLPSLTLSAHWASLSHPRKLLLVLTRSRILQRLSRSSSVRSFPLLMFLAFQCDQMSEEECSSWFASATAHGRKSLQEQSPGSEDERETDLVPGPFPMSRSGSCNHTPSFAPTAADSFTPLSAPDSPHSLRLSHATVCTTRFPLKRSFFLSFAATSPEQCSAPMHNVRSSAVFAQQRRIDTNHASTPSSFSPFSTGASSLFPEVPVLRFFSDRDAVRSIPHTLPDASASTASVAAELVESDGWQIQQPPREHREVSTRDASATVPATSHHNSGCDALPPRRHAVWCTHRQLPRQALGQRQISTGLLSFTPATQPSAAATASESTCSAPLNSHAPSTPSSSSSSASSSACMCFMCREVLTGVHVNSAFERVFGWRQDEVSEMFLLNGFRAFFSIVRLESWARILQQHVSELLTGTGAYSGYVECQTKDGAIIQCLHLCQGSNPEQGSTGMHHAFIPLPNQQVRMCM
jgi:PAS domain-containing protein